MARVNVTRLIKRQLAALLVDLLDGSIDDKEATAKVLRDLADEIENG